MYGVDNDDSFLDEGGLAAFTLVDKGCNERLSGGVITFRKRRPFVKSVDRSMVNIVSHDFKSY